MELAALMTIDVVVAPPLDVGAVPLGHRRVIPFDGGTFEARGEVRGTIAPGGVDWQLTRPDGVIEIDAHYLLLTDEGEPIEVRSTGLRKVSAEVAERLAAGEAVAASEYHDAAHPMYPIGSNGASQAILDARVLAGCLRAEPDVVAALERYQDVRLPATAAIVEANRGLGPEVPLQLVHERAPDGFDDIDAVITPAEIDEVTEAYRRTAGFALSALRDDPRSLIDQTARP